MDITFSGSNNGLMPDEAFCLFFFCFVFLLRSFLGAIFCTDSLSNDDSAGLSFSRANADLRYTQSDMPSTFTTSSF